MSTEKGWDKKRLETFVDAVIAIIMTILVLELKVPAGHFDKDGDLLKELGHQAPFFLSYFLAFFTLVAVWIDHHRLFTMIPKVDKRYAILNCIFLFTLSMLPFTTALAGEHVYSSMAVAIFCFNIFIMNIGFMFIFMYPQKKKWYDEEDMKNPETIRSGKISMIGMLIEITSIPLAFVNPLFAFCIVFIVLLMHLVKK